MGVGCDVHVTHLERAKFSVILERLSFFVVSEDVFKVEPNVPSRCFGFEDGVKEWFGDGAVDPHLDEPVVFFLLLFCVRSWLRGAIEVVGDTKAGTVSLEQLTPHIIVWAPRLG